MSFLDFFKKSDGKLELRICKSEKGFVLRSLKNGFEDYSISSFDNIPDDLNRVVCDNGYDLVVIDSRVYSLGENPERLHNARDFAIKLSNYFDLRGDNNKSKRINVVLKDSKIKY